ncbi:MAG: hypothetical protein RL219_1909 [Actinomycetota bacterium]
MSVLEVRDLDVRFPTEDGTVHAARSVSFVLDSGEILAVVGESGSGKSVTAMAIMGLLPPNALVSGSVLLGGEEILGIGRHRLSRIRGRRIGMIFQDPMSSLNPVYRIGWQLAEAVRAHNTVSRRAAQTRAVELLQMVGIPEAERRVNGYPHEFSGGMRQRVMIAMAMANEPEVLIADEPTTALDVTVQAQVLETLMRVKETSGVSILLITHDLGVVASMADRVQVMYAGAVVESGTSDEIFYSPRMPYTAALLRAMPTLVGRHGRLDQIPGAPPSLIALGAGCPFAPRCALAAEQCRESEPLLAPTDAATHLAACVRWPELLDRGVQ